MSNGDRRKGKQPGQHCGLNDSLEAHTDERQTEELMKTLVELNHSVNNINKLIQQLQKNITSDAARHIDNIATRTLH